MFNGLTTLVIGILSGIYIGKQLQLHTENQSLPKSRKGNEKEKEDDEVEDDESDYESEEEEEDVGILVNTKGLNSIPGEVRMALIVRTDLGMLKGKSAAQCSHAAVTLYKQMKEGKFENNEMLKRWSNGGQAKIVLKCNSIEEIEELMMKAVSLDINNYLVHDAGRTQIASGSATVLGLGPAPRSVLDIVTSELKLY